MIRRMALRRSGSGMKLIQMGVKPSFDMRLSGSSLYDDVTGTPASCSISGARWGIVKGVVSSFASNMPPVEDKGLRGCPAFTQLAKMTETLTDAVWVKNNILTPVLSTSFRGANVWSCSENSADSVAHTLNQGALSGIANDSVIGISSVAKYKGRKLSIYGRVKEGSYVLICIFDLLTGQISSLRTGSAASCVSVGDGFFSVFATLPVGVGVNNPIIYFELRNETTNVYTGDGVSGVYLSQPTIINFGVNGIPFIPPYVPNNTTSSISVVSEEATSTTGTSFDLDLATLSRLKTGLRGPNAQGHIELEFESNVDSGWLASGITTNLNILSANNGVQNLLYLTKDSGEVLSFRINDGSAFTLTGVSGNVITVGQTFRISIDYGTYTDGTQKMRLTVNGFKSSGVAFSGSFGTQDLKFFFGNTVHIGWIKKDSLKYYEKPRW